jgi:hypothetical protein
VRAGPESPTKSEAFSLQVTLSIPGAGPLVGEGFVAKIRIDDDDIEAPLCDADVSQTKATAL